jgi:hypothetical protein
MVAGAFPRGVLHFRSEIRNAGMLGNPEPTGGLCQGGVDSCGSVLEVSALRRWPIATGRRFSPDKSDNEYGPGKSKSQVITIEKIE